MTSAIAAWRPTPKQDKFLTSAAFEALYGGAAGGGKSEALLVAALRLCTSRHYRGILFRRTFTDLEKSLIDRSQGIYKRAFPDARYNEQKKVWTFPSGAKIYFGHIEHEADVFSYQSAEFQFIGFDELTHFTERQYMYMLTRARSSQGLPVRIRAATNPGGVGHDWVFKRWAPWLDPEHDVQAEPGQRVYYAVDGGGETCIGTTPATGAVSRVFIPAKLDDNPHLTDADPDYEKRILVQDDVTRSQLRDGDWIKRVGEGRVYSGFDRKIHIREPLDGTVWTETIVGVDFGFVDPGVFLLCGIAGSGNDSTIHALHEVYETGQDIDWWTDRAREIHAWYPNAKWFADPSRPDTITTLRRRAGINIIGADNSIDDGVSTVANFIALRDSPAGRYARFYISSRCKNTIAEFAAYRRKIRSGEQTESIMPGNDHAMDSARYAIHTRFKHSTRTSPRAERSAEIRQR